MLKRLNIYFKEMYPLLPRLILGIIVFGEIYFIVLLNHGITKFNIGIPEFVGAFTVFSFLCWLRIADDFKDYELDCRLFAHRPLVFMNNFPFFLFLYIYGTLMSLWFFSKKKIQKSLPLALVTHNPVQMIMNIYIISFAIIKYDLKIVTLQNIMAVMTLYFPALIWEVTRKIRAPKDETEYVTYSKLFGYKKAATFALVVTILDIITNFILVWNLSKISVAALFINVCWMTWKFIEFMGDPNKFKIVDKVERYTYIQESIMLITVAAYILSIRFGFKLP